MLPACPSTRMSGLVICISVVQRSEMTLEVTRCCIIYDAMLFSLKQIIIVIIVTVSVRKFLSLVCAGRIRSSTDLSLIFTISLCCEICYAAGSSLSSSRYKPSTGNRTGNPAPPLVATVILLSWCVHHVLWSMRRALSIFLATIGDHLGKDIIRIR
jgi:hypothetical protein